MIAAVADCFSALKIPVKNFMIVFSKNREISLFCRPSTWKLWKALYLTVYVSDCTLVEKLTFWYDISVLHQNTSIVTSLHQRMEIVMHWHANEQAQ